MLVAEEPIEVVPTGIARLVRATEIVVSRSDTASAGVASAALDADASPCSAWGTADISCEPLDVDDCATAAPWLPAPAGVVVGGGEVDGVSVDAVADDRRSRTSRPHPGPTSRHSPFRWPRSPWCSVRRQS